jgi:hypothetical protein
MGVLASFLASQTADEKSQRHDEKSQRSRSESQGFSSESQKSRESQALLTKNEASIKHMVKDKVYLIEIPTVDGELSLPSPAENENPVTPVATSATFATLAATPAQSTPSDDASASVDNLLEAMAAENERRRDWWKQPVEGWREGRIAWRSVVTGEETVLRFPKPKRSGQ